MLSLHLVSVAVILSLFLGVRGPFDLHTSRPASFHRSRAFQANHGVDGVLFIPSLKYM